MVLWLGFLRKNTFNRSFSSFSSIVLSKLPERGNILEDVLKVLKASSNFSRNKSSFWQYSFNKLKSDFFIFGLLFEVVILRHHILCPIIFSGSIVMTLCYNGAIFLSKFVSNIVFHYLACGYNCGGNLASLFEIKPNHAIFWSSN